MGQFVLAGVIAIVGGVVGCAIYLPKMFNALKDDDYKQFLLNGLRSLFFLLIFGLGISMIPYYS